MPPSVGRETEDAGGYAPISPYNRTESNIQPTHPNAGLVYGNGFSFDKNTCAADKVCNGGNAGLLFGDGGNGFNGGNGGNGGEGGFVSNLVSKGGANGKPGTDG